MRDEENGMSDIGYVIFIALSNIRAPGWRKVYNNGGGGDFYYRCLLRNN